MKNIFILLVLVCAGASTSTAQWVQTGGPVNGQVSCLAASGQDLFAGTLGEGLYYSSDGGATWQKASGAINPPYIGCVTVTDSGLVVGTSGAANNGILFSTDNGASWSATSTGNAGVNALLALDDTTVLAGYFTGLMRSTDGGRNWNSVSPGPSSVDAFTRSGPYVFAGTTTPAMKVWRSSDNGSTWIVSDTGMPTSINVSSLAAFGSTILAGTVDAGVYISTNSGSSWTASNNGLSNVFVQSFAVFGGKVFAGTEGGVFLSSDSGASWKAINQGLLDTLVFSLAAGGTDLFAGTNSQVYRIPLSYFSSLSLPQLESPSDNSIDQALSPVLYWIGDNSAFEYHLQVSRDSLFATIVYDDSTVTTSSQRVGPLMADSSYFWRVKSVNLGGSSKWTGARMFRTHALSPAALLAPADNSVNQPDTLSLSWSAAAYASAYHLTVAPDSNFNSKVFDDSTITGTSAQVGPLISNTQYFWRVMTIDSGSHSAWSPTRSFRTLILPPSSVSALPGNGKITLSWQASLSQGVARYIIYRGTSPSALAVTDSTSGTTYVDSALTNGIHYTYAVASKDSNKLEGPLSQEVTAMPFNEPPHAASLGNVYRPSAGAVASVPLTFSSAGSYDPDGTVDSLYWYINGKFVTHDSALTRNFGQGTDSVMLVVEDNQGAKDTSRAIVSTTMFSVRLKGPVLAGPSMMGDSILYVIGTGDAVYRMNAFGNLLYSLQVNGDVRSSSSIAYDTTVYIASSDKNLYAFSKSGTSKWPALPLGGVMTSTPAVDSVTNMIFVGISNNNFFAVNRSTGTVAWNYFVDAPVVGCAAITLDRKLLFATVKGTIYGFDLAHLGSQPSPSWQLSLTDSIYGSPAVDDSGNVYFCSASGAVYCIELARSQPARVLWQVIIGERITGSPVIDGYGTLYIGAADGKLYAVNTRTGKIKWAYATAAPIYSTAAVSDVDMIYVGNHGGKVCALDTSASLHWYYQDSTGVDAPLLYNNGALYIGTTGGKLVAVYDHADSSLRSVAKSTRLKTVAVAAPVPVWGTFQGNNRRTGTPVGRMMTPVLGRTNPVPASFALEQNFPNPFNPTTTIKFALPEESQVTVTIYDILGRKVTELVNDRLQAGYYSYVWDASRFASGVYFYRIVAQSPGAHKKGFMQLKKLMLVK